MPKQSSRSNVNIFNKIQYNFSDIGTTPTSLPKRFNIWFTLSRRKVCLPCSNSRTRRNPTPDFSESSTCVRLYCLRIAFTYLESVVCSIDTINYTLSGANIVKVFSFYTLSGIILSFLYIFYTLSGIKSKLATIATLQYSLNIAFPIEDFTSELAVRQII